MFKITDYADRAARRDGAARVVARARARDAAELDRPLRGRRDPLPDRGARRGRAGLHDAAGHALRRDVLRARAGAPARRAAGRASRRTPTRSARTRATPPRRRARSALASEEKTGVFTGFHAVNPVNGERIPIWIADYVLMDYGTGAIMAVPAHDERDFAFAQRFGLPIVQVVAPADGEVDRTASRTSRTRTTRCSSTRASSPACRRRRRSARSSSGSSARGRGRSTINYRLRDWLLSRQRYWGCPIPVVHCERGGIVPVPDDELPVLLPEVEDYLPKGRSPLAAAEDWVHDDVPDVRRPGAARDRHDGHVRRLVLVLPPLHRPAQRRGAVRPRDGRLLAAGQPVHRRDRARDPAPDVRALLHEGAERPRPARLPRAVRAALQPGDDLPLRREDVEVEGERRRARRAGRAATAPTRCGSTSSSWARPTRTRSGRTPASRGCRGFLQRLWRVVHEELERAAGAASTTGTPLARKAHETIAKVTDDIERRFVFNTPVAAVMELVNEISRDAGRPGGAVRGRDGGVADPAVRAARGRGAVGAARRLAAVGRAVAGRRRVAARARRDRARAAGERQGARPDPGAGGAARGGADRAREVLREGAGAPRRRGAARLRRAGQARQPRRRRG